MKKYLLSAMGVVAAFAMAGQATAELLSVENGSFESPPLNDGGWRCPIEEGSGWAGVGTSTGQGIQNPPSSLFNEATLDGFNTVFVTTGGVVQDLAATYIEGMSYSLTVAVGRRKDTASDRTVGWRISLGDDDGAEIADQSGTILENTGGVVEGDMFDVNLSYVATADDAGKTIRIGLWRDGGSAQVNFDNVRLDVTQIPEPSIPCMTILGVFCLATLKIGRRQRRR